MTDIVDLDRLRARLAELDAEREPLLALIRAAEAYEGVVGQTLFSRANVTARPKPGRGTGRGRAAPVMEATTKAVAEVLELFGPQSTGDLMNLVGDRPDLNLPPKNPINVLSARLSNSENFQTRRGVGWWFADRPWPNEESDENVELSLSEEEPNAV